MVYWPVAKEISFKDISIFSSGGQLNTLINFGRRHHDEHFFEIILNLDQWNRRRCHSKTFLI